MVTPTEFHKIAAEVTVQLGFTPDYEREQLGHFQQIVLRAKRFIDVGANRGLYANLANRVMTGGSIALIEANPEMASRLREAIETWPTENGNRIEVFSLAASDKAGILPFFTDPTDTFGSCVRESWEVRLSSSIDVQTQTLDTLFPPQPGTVIKIDVEGFEFRVLQGAQRLLASDDIRLVMELHGWGDPERRKYPLQVLWLMITWGFKTTRVGVSHTYDFTRAGPIRRTRSLLRWGPVFLTKHVVDRTGTRSIAYHVLSSRLLRMVAPHVAERASFRLSELNQEVHRTGGLGPSG